MSGWAGSRAFPSLDPLTQLLHVLQATTPVGSEADNCIVHDLTGHGPEHPNSREYTAVLPPGGHRVAAVLSQLCPVGDPCES